MNAKILAFSGSIRTGSFNSKLIKIAADAARDAGADVTLMDLADYDLPIMNQDLEKDGRPENVQKLKDLFESHDALLISCPEYNSSITPLLKNTIDWVSRPDEGKPPLSAFQGKVCGLIAASPGALGGLRGLVHVRSILGNIGVTVVPKQLAVSKAHDAFDENGNLNDEKQAATVREIVQTVTNYAQRLNPE